MKTAPANVPGIEADELHREEIDAFVAKNREALNESIRRSRDEIVQDLHETRSIDQIIGDGRKRRRAAS
jgi:dsDNA-binding SOS-regulon protein